MTLNATESTTLIDASILNSNENVLNQSFNETLNATSIESPLNTTIPVDIKSTISPYVIFNDVHPTYPEEILLFGIGKSYLWNPTIYMTPIESNVPALSENSTTVSVLISDETTQITLITTPMPLSLNTSLSDNSILETTPITLS